MSVKEEDVFLSGKLTFDLNCVCQMIDDWLISRSEESGSCRHDKAVWQNVIIEARENKSMNYNRQQFYKQLNTILIVNSEHIPLGYI